MTVAHISISAARTQQCLSGLKAGKKCGCLPGALRQAALSLAHRRLLGPGWAAGSRCPPPQCTSFVCSCLPGDRGWSRSASHTPQAACRPAGPCWAAGLMYPSGPNAGDFCLSGAQRGSCHASRTPQAAWTCGWAAGGKCPAARCALVCLGSHSRTVQVRECANMRLSCSCGLPGRACTVGDSRSSWAEHGVHDLPCWADDVQVPGHACPPGDQNRASATS